MPVRIEFSKRDIKRILSRYTRGEGIEVIAIDFNCSPGVIIRVLREYRVKLRNHGPLRKSFQSHAHQVPRLMQRRPERKLTKSERRQIAAYYESGASALAIGKMYGVNESAILRILNADGVPIRKSREPVVSIAEIERIKRLYADGNTVKQIGKLVGTGTVTAWKVLRRNGCRLRQRGCTSKSLTKLTMSEKRIARLYCFGKNIHRIAQLTGDPQASVRAAIRRAGWQLEFTKGERQAAAKLYRECSSIAKISNQFGASQYVTKLIVSGEGEVIRKGLPNQVHFREGIELEMVRKYISGVSIARLKRKYGRHESVIKRILTRNGVKIRRTSWKGGRFVRGGYVIVYAPEHPSVRNRTSKYVREHRLVMEKHLGRILESNEQVHHRNQDKLDNDISNLEVVLRTAHRGHVNCPYCRKQFAIQ